MMDKSVYLLTFALIVSTTGFKISSTCVDTCKSTSSLYCTNECKLKTSSLLERFDRATVNKCLKPCLCNGKELAFPDDEECESLQILATSQSNCLCVHLKNLNVKVRSSDDASNTNPWENWCKHQCAQGLGGSACYCDIIP